MKYVYKSDVDREVTALQHPKEDVLTRRTKVLIVFFKMILYVLLDIRDLMIKTTGEEFPVDPSGEAVPPPEADSTPEDWLDKVVTTGSVEVFNSWYDFSHYNRGKVHGRDAALEVAKELLS